MDNYKFQVTIYQDKENTLGGCILISSLPGMSLKTLLESQGLLSDSTWVLKAEPGRLDIKRHKAGILFISLPS